VSKTHEYVSKKYYYVDKCEREQHERVSTYCEWDKYEWSERKRKETL